MLIGEKFHINGEFSLVKSTGASQGKASGGIVIRGRILNGNAKDAQGERPLIKKMDWSMFDQNGYIKDEHDDIILQMDKAGKVTGQKIENNPDKIIGVPLRRITEGNSVFLEAAIFPDSDRSQKYINLITNLEKHNKLYPDAQRHVGFSIEGSYVEKFPDGTYAGKVYNVALTPKPTDPSTYAEIVSMAKSMAAGYAVTPETMTGGGALREESLEGNKFHQKHKKSGDTMFKNKGEVVAHHKKQGKNHAEATKLAEEWEAEQNQEKTAVAEKMEKCYGGAKKALEKGLEVVNTFLGGFVKSRETSVSCLGEMKKSLQPGQDGAVDGMAYIEKGMELQAAIGEQNLLNAEAIVKSVGASIEGHIENLELLKSIRDEQVRTREFVQSLTDDVTTIVRGMQKGFKATTTENLSTLAVDDPEKIEKSLNGKQVQDFLGRKVVEAGKAGNEESIKLYNGAFDAYRRGGIGAVNKSIVTEIETALLK